MGLTLARALRLQRNLPGNRKSSNSAGSIAFVGSGGKTTAVFQLARQLQPPVLVTTTTHLGTWQVPLADEHVILQDAVLPPRFSPNGVTLVTGSVGSDDRVDALSREGLLWLRDTAREQGSPLLIEADGALQKPLKAAAQHEPAIPPFAEVVVVVAGLGGLGKPLSAEVVHRPELFAELSGTSIGELITPHALTQVLLSPQGGLKGIPPTARRILLLNQADSSILQSVARGMAAALVPPFDAVVVASLERSEIHAVHELAAAIVLAAGASRRLGRPKQLLDWHGQPFVRGVALTALKAGLRPVVVVVGAGSAEVQAAVKDLPVETVNNENWQSGQASSIQAGLRSLPASSGSAVFLLADQPQVTPDVITALVDAHASGLPPIVAPLVLMERRANPVLFDRDTFPDLLRLRGDVGGRAVFSEYRVEYLPWHDDRLLLDVDTEADYKRLVEDDTR